MASKVILIPTKRVMVDDGNGKQVEAFIPNPDAIEGLDLKPGEFAIKRNYHDVMKVEVSGTDSELRKMAEKSKEYFDAAWGKKPS